MKNQKLRPSKNHSPFPENESLRAKNISTIKNRLMTTEKIKMIL
ncbi:hypothetical protein [Epilithonimonas vandammei]|nr:hypothetical protein [Epilithonimonas vandammei]